MNTLTTRELQQMQETGESFLLVNTLDEQHFADTEIPGAVSIPQDNDDFVQQVEKKAGSKDQKIVVYCASADCNSSTKGGEKLEKAGFSNVYDFEAGAKGWKKARSEAATV